MVLKDRNSNVDFTELFHIPSNLKFQRKQSVKGSGNSAFLQKDQLCYLKRAENLTFELHLFFIEQHAKLLHFLLMLAD